MTLVLTLPEDAGKGAPRRRSPAVVTFETSRPSDTSIAWTEPEADWDDVIEREDRLDVLEDYRFEEPELLDPELESDASTESVSIPEYPPVAMRFPRKAIPVEEPAVEPAFDPVPGNEEPDAEELTTDPGPADADPVLLESPQPAYPLLARRSLWEGVVTCRITVRADGSVARVAVERSSGRGVLDDAALKALMKWRFKPGLRQGAAAEVDVLHRVVFKVRG